MKAEIEIETSPVKKWVKYWLAKVKRLMGVQQSGGYERVTREYVFEDAQGTDFSFINIRKILSKHYW